MLYYESPLLQNIRQKCNVISYLYHISNIGDWAQQYLLYQPNTCTKRVQYYHGLLIIVLCTITPQTKGRPRQYMILTKAFGSFNRRVHSKEHYARRIQNLFFLHLATEQFRKDFSFNSTVFDLMSKEKYL